MTTRRLAAILAADVAGYSRLMAADEVGTLSTLKAVRREIVDPAIAEHNGRIVKTTGDGMLAEFASAVDAVTCAMAVQSKMAGRGGDIAFRMGINIGDVIIDGDDIFGDGVNVAARVESQCQPGGVYLSDDAFRQVRGKTPFAFDDLGDMALKNIDRPVRIHSAHPAGRAPASNALLEPGKPLSLPDKPSIAVLPFQNMSQDPEQDYFADGMVEDIITSLSRKKGLFVIARNSSFFYKGKQFDVRAAAKELGVRYVLEGSVRKAGNRVRITGQLIEARDGTHLWANRFDRSLDNIFDLQDEITADVVSAIAPEIQRAEIDRARRKPTADLTAYDYYLRAIASQHVMPITLETTFEARRLFGCALDIDPRFAPALAYLAASSVRLILNGWTDDPDTVARDAVEMAHRALSLDRADPEVLIRGGWTIGSPGKQPKEGLSLIEEGLALDANHALGWAWSGALNGRLGNHETALAQVRHALRLSPRDAQRHVMLSILASSHFFLGGYQEAASFAEEVVKLEPHQLVQRKIAIAAYALAGRAGDAERAIERLLALEPSASISSFARSNPYRRAEDRARLIEGLRLAGLPE